MRTRLVIYCRVRNFRPCSKDRLLGRRIIYTYISTYILRVLLRFKVHMVINCIAQNYAVPQPHANCVVSCALQKKRKERKERAPRATSELTYIAYISNDNIICYILIEQHQLEVGPVGLSEVIKTITHLVNS